MQAVLQWPWATLCRRLQSQYKHHNFAAALPYYENALKAPGYQPLAVKAAYKGMALAYRGLGDSENASKYEELEKKVNIPPETQ